MLNAGSCSNISESVDFGARHYDPFVSRWLSPDPLMEKYYGMSPYLYCAGNPVNLVDPDGEEIWIIIDRKGRNATQLKYSEGNLYYSNGEVYDGHDSFALAILSTINTLYSFNDERITSRLLTLETSTRKHYIENSTQESNHVRPLGDYGHSLANSGIKVGSQVFISFSNGSIEKGLETTKETTLGHELKHAYDYDQGKYKDLVPYKGKGPKDIDPKEISAVVFENFIRQCQGLPLRTSYGEQIKPTLLKNPIVF